MLWCCIKIRGRGYTGSGFIADSRASSALKLPSPAGLTVIGAARIASKRLRGTGEGCSRGARGASQGVSTRRQASRYGRALPRERLRPVGRRLGRDR
jgi:hypothetical protein